MKYRKKPIVIDAVQLTWETWSDVCELLGDAIPQKAHGVYLDDEGRPLPTDESGEHIGLVITTVHGDQAIAREGDWVIPDAAPGTFYPCKPDIFAATYEPATAEMPSPRHSELTCAPAEGILTVSAETVEALDVFAATLDAHRHWQIDTLIGRTPADTIHLTARPRQDQETAA